jgi:NTP pyrophosphatase (non-canonical NTP hydrolase)
MELKTYQEAAFRTCPNLGEQYRDIFINADQIEEYNKLAMKLNLSHMVHGMCSELSELSDAEQSLDQVNIAEEMIDILWYVAGYCTFKNYSLEEVFQATAGTMKSLSWHIHELTDIVKKFEAYNKPINEIDEVHHLGSIIYWIKFVLGKEIFDKATDNNINKLRVRYPEKFSNEAAINRDLAAERRELEK